MNEVSRQTTNPGRQGVEVIARGLLQIGSKVLLCRSRSGGYSYLPGGHVEPNEMAAQACHREFLEETGLAVRVGKCLLVCEVLFEQAHRACYEINLVFHVEHEKQGQLREEEIMKMVASQEDHLAFDWVDLASISDIDLRPNAIRAWIISGGETDPAIAPHWITSDERP